MFAKLIRAVLISGMGASALAAKDLKVLMIGNSFSICVGSNLPQIVQSVPGHRLELTSAYIGGCPLDRHCANLREADKYPEFKPYRITFWSSEAPNAPRVDRGNVNSLLKKNRYDVITIQQASPKSWDYATYLPHADELISYIRQYQPQAEIVIQQTWSYRSDHPKLQPNPNASWPFDQTGMYERLREAYRKLAEKYKFRVIPTGDAIQKYRQYTPVKYRPDPKKPEFPQLPSRVGDAVGSASWRKDPKTGENKLHYDNIHLNPTGEYLQACLWFAFLYGENVQKIAYVPAHVSAEENALLRKCAQEALDEYKQAK